MTSGNDNVIIFPKWKEMLEEESLQALKERKYEVALGKLNQLISFQTSGHEIMMGKLICLIELGNHKEAEDLCESLLTNPDEHYYHYLHIYLTILFQTNQYELLMRLVEEEVSKENIPEALKNQITQLYELSSNMQKDIVDEEILVFERDFEEALKENDYQRQWQIIEKMRHININPKLKLIQYLQDEEVHPVVKTSILDWLYDSNHQGMIKLMKFNQETELTSLDMVPIKNQLIFKQTLLVIKDLEQENPSLYKFLEQLLYQYLYVKTPFLPREEDVTIIAKALKVIGKESFGKKVRKEDLEESKLLSYIEEMKLCQSLYLSVVED